MFKKWCIRRLEALGWRVSGAPWPADCRIDRGNVELLAAFVSPGSSVGPALIQDLMALRAKHPISLLIVTNSAPTQEAIGLQAERANLLIGCAGLDHVEEALVLLQDRLKEKFNEGTGNFTLELLHSIASREDADGNYARAAELWRQFRGAAPQLDVGFSKEAYTRIKLGDYHAAAEILGQAKLHHFASPSCNAAHCYLAEAEDGDPEVALNCWLEYRVHFPDLVDGYLRGARFLGRLGREAEVEALLAEAKSRFPTLKGLDSAIAHSLEQRGKQNEAVLAWERMVSQEGDTAREAGAGLKRCLQRLSND